jgi:hypothetical protein
MAEVMSEYAVFWRPVKGPPTVSHVFVTAGSVEAALKAGEKAVGPKGVCFRADPEPTWSVDK